MHRCTSLEMMDITEAVEQTTGNPNAILFVRQTIGAMDSHHWFKKDGLFVHVERIGLHKYSVHTFGISRMSIANKKEFFIEIGCWMLDNTDCTTICVFVPASNLALRILMNKIKKVPTCFMPNGNGEDEGEYLYTFDKEDRRELCHKQSQ